MLDCRHKPLPNASVGYQTSPETLGTMVWVLLAVTAFAILTQKPFCAMVLFQNYVSAQC